MRTTLIDVRDDEALCNALTQVFLFVEHVNGRASQEARRLLDEKLCARDSEEKKLSSQAQAEEILWSVARPDLDFKNIILQVLQRLAVEGSRWSDQTPLLAHLRRESISPEVHPPIILAVAELMLRPARVIPGTWKIDKQPKVLPRASGIDLLTEKMWVYDGEHGPLLATRPLLPRSHLFSHRLHIYCWEEPFDAIGIMRLFLAEVLGEKGRSADHYIQRWLRTRFHLNYDKSSKYTLAVICELFNRLFYGNVSPTIQEVHTQRTPTVSVSLLLNELALVLQHASEAGDGSANASRQAIGIYLFLCFCRQLRRRFFWIDLENARERQIPDESLRCLAGMDGQPCIGALRPLGYTYFQSRIFGFISTIPGLTNVFRGGILPRTSNGRSMALLGPAGIGKTVLALQWILDFARCGGLAIYLSFEESFDSILDRLVTFGLIDPQKFQVRQASNDLPKVLREARREPEKGLLIFYRASEGTLFEIIQLIAEGAGDWPRSRPKALVIDSVNALEFAFNAAGNKADARQHLHSVVARIESSNFFGLLLGEAEGEYYKILPYLADTVLEMGFNENAHTRWFEIRKCRVQDYHEGKHPLRIHDGRGVIIYPSLASRRSSLRGRVRSTLSQWRFISYPSKGSEFKGLAEKSSTLILGPQASGKTLVGLRFLVEPSTFRQHPDSAVPKEISEKELWRPQNVMVITFRTSEKNYLQALRRHQDLASNWARIPLRWLRWYSPGSNLTAEQIVSEIWKYFKESRRMGVPVDRVLFDETETAEDSLTALRRDPLFWPTILELTSTEAVTSLFVCGRTESLAMQLQGSMDNILHVRQESTESQIIRHIEVQQHFESAPVGVQQFVEQVQSSL